MKLPLEEAARLTRELLAALGVPSEDAQTAAEVYLRAALRGAGHHDLSDLPGRLKKLEEGTVNPAPRFKRLGAFGALERYDGDNGLGEIAGAFAIRRAMRLADSYGLGLCAVRSSNHILCCAPFTEMAAEQGYLGYLVTRGAPTMGAPGRAEKVIGTSPQGFAAPAGAHGILSFDACLAYASNGELARLRKNGEAVPDYWGLNAQGEPCRDPGSILKGGTRLPIGGHKGFGLALLGELMTGVLSSGALIDETDPLTGRAGVPSHTALAIRADALLGKGELSRRTEELVSRMKARADRLRIPGERAQAACRAARREGTLELPLSLIKELERWCGRLGVAMPHTGTNEIKNGGADEDGTV